jgi:hypothetical protein
VASIKDGELLGELEDEMGFQEGSLHEDEMEAEGIFGALGSALSGLLGEGEDEFGESHELGEGGFESELAGESEGQFEDELAYEGEMGELESGELFFGRLLRRALPVLRRVAKVAAPMIGTAFGGPLGGAIGGLVSRNLEGEMEDEFGELGEIGELGEMGEMGELGELGELGEFEDELGEGQFEVQEVAAEYETYAHAEASEHEAHAELMAAAAAGAESELEAEAMIGAATWATLTARERRELRRALPHMVRATAILTRLLRRRRITRPMVRTVPTIVHHTARTLVRNRARTGRPITRRQAARAMTMQTRRVLTQPRACSLALQRNVRATRRLQRVAQVPIRGARVPAARPRSRARY